MSSKELLAEHESVHGYVGRVCFKTGPPGRVGAELEWLVASPHDPRRHAPARRIEDTCSGTSPLPCGSRLTLEPGGQVELSSQVAPNLDSCWRGLEHDIRVLDSLLEQQRLTRLTTAIDPSRPSVRVVHSPRYDAMQAYFDRDSDEGLVMMASTASTQVNLDAGDGLDDVVWRWKLLHAVGPTLVAAFANSPIQHGRVTGWKSTRQKVWNALDPARTRPVPNTGSVAADPIGSWAEYALDAPVMMLRRPGRWLSAPGFTFREWVSGRTPFGRPSEEDLAYHLTTLFPPVRPRGWFEVRYLDAQPDESWPVPIAVVTALLEDHSAGDLALDATAPVRDGWRDAAKFGLSDPALGRAAQRCFEAAIAALHRLNVERPLIGLVERFADRFVARRRSPADSQLESSPLRNRPRAREKVQR